MDETQTTLMAVARAVACIAASMPAEQRDRALGHLATMGDKLPGTPVLEDDPRAAAQVNGIVMALLSSA